MERFSKNGRLIIPLGQRNKGAKETNEEKVRYVVTEACPCRGFRGAIFCKNNLTVLGQMGTIPRLF
jgi:hypothetical protein